jgi:hypothetical protein
MEVLIPIIWIAIAVLRIIFRERGIVAIVERPGALCRSCASAHLVRGFSGKERIWCAFGGAPRPVKFEVRECSGFSSRLVSIAPVRVQGFIRKKSEVLAEVRIE